MRYRMDDDLRSCQVFIEQFWDDDSWDQGKIEAVHQRMTSIHEAQQLIDEQITQLELYPVSMVEPFLRSLYANEDFRAQIEGI